MSTTISINMCVKSVELKTETIIQSPLFDNVPQLSDQHPLPLFNQHQ